VSILPRIRHPESSTAAGNELVVQRIQEGRSWDRTGCTVGGLGAYTSIVTADGTALVAPPGMKLSTGNALTVAVGVHRVSKLCRRHGIDATAPSTRLGILGAAGSIGSALAHGFACAEPPFRSLLLVGRRQDTLETVADRLRAATGGLGDVEVSTKLSALRGCNVIAAATGTNEPLLYPRHLSSTGPVIGRCRSRASWRRTRELGHVHVAGRTSLCPTPDFTMASHIAPGLRFVRRREHSRLGSQETADLVLSGRSNRGAWSPEALARRWGCSTRRPTRPERGGE
jgi:predicted amino acid dehydrogenase